MDYRNRIKLLKKYNDSKYPILSLYLSINEGNTPRAVSLTTQFHSIQSQKMSKEEKKFWKIDLKKIELHLKEYLSRSSYGSLLFFVSGKKLWEVIETELSFSPLLMIDNSPYTEPLENKINTNKKYLILLADRKKAKFIIVSLGKIEKYKEYTSTEVPQKVKAKTINLGRTDKIMRDIENHLNKHLENISIEANKFVSKNNIRYLIIGSHQELLPKIDRTIPYPLNKLIKAQFVIELNTPIDQIVFKSEKIINSLPEVLT